MAAGTFVTFYDVSRDWSGRVIPVLMSAGWLLGYLVAIRVAKSKDQKRVFLWVWLTMWTVLGGFGFGSVWYQYFHCIQELKSGHFQVVEGPITNFRPEVGKNSEQLAVGGVTFEYYSATLSGGLR
jgi:hypothetical protein